MDFPYPCGDNHSDKTPEGAWRFLWSHLPRYLKEYFYGTFQNGGAYSTEQTRRTTQQWLTAFRYYLRLLQEGKLQDPESAEIFPTRWKVTDPAARTVWERRTLRRVRQRLRHHGEREGLLQGEGDVPAPPLSDLPKTAP